MAQLPIFQDPNQNLMLMQTRWKSILDPVIGNPTANGNIIKNVTLNAGSTSINHGLQRMQQGWQIIDIQGPVYPYRSAPFNSTNLILGCASTTIVSVWCF